HKNLDAANLFSFIISAQYFLYIIVGHTHEKRIIRQGVSGSLSIFLLQQLLSEGGRLGIGHFHKRGGPTGNGSSGFAMDIGFMRQARIPEMHLIVNYSGKQPQAFGYQFLNTGRRVYARSYFPDLTIGYPNIRYLL